MIVNLDALEKAAAVADPSSGRDYTNSLARRMWAALVWMEGGVKVDDGDRLEKLAQDTLSMSAPAPRYGSDYETWERNVKGKLAEVFRLGMDVGWEKWQQ
jgi:hypothetical protein